MTSTRYRKSRCSLELDALLDRDRVLLQARDLIRILQVHDKLLARRQGGGSELYAVDGNLQATYGQTRRWCATGCYSYLGALSTGGRAGDDAQAGFPARQTLVLSIELRVLVHALRRAGLVACKTLRMSMSGAGQRHAPELTGGGGGDKVVFLVLVLQGGCR